MPLVLVSEGPRLEGVEGEVRELGTENSLPFATVQGEETRKLLN